MYAEMGPTHQGTTSYFVPKTELLMAPMNGHAQEATAFSTTETVLGDEVAQEARPARTSNLSRITTTTLGRRTEKEKEEDGEQDSPEQEWSPSAKPRPSRRPTMYDPSRIPAVIPSEHLGRTLVLCFDGTGDQFDLDNSNVVQFFSMLKKDDRSKQMVYYQSGIGTYSQMITPVAAKLSKIVDEAIAWNLDAHVMDGYSFLMENYTAGDRINIFGFSRGAYTARALAGFLHKIGLLPASNHQQVPFAYKMYTRADEIGWRQSNAFKAAFCTDVDIEFVGVWDTVASVGLISRRLPFTTSNSVVKTFRHALALDEHRAKFQPNIWHKPNAHESTLGTPPPSNRATVDDMKHKKDILDKKKKESDGSDAMLSALERMYSNACNRRETDVLEVWFAGNHSDVGGGSVPNEERHSLARISLRWMVRETFKTHTGIMFNSEGLKSLGIDPSSLLDPFVEMTRPSMSIPDGIRVQRPRSGRSLKRKVMSLFKPKPDPNAKPAIVVPSKNQPRNLSEEEQDTLDVMSPAYDQLKITPSWWILEFLPMKFKYQNNDDSWGQHYRWNLGRARDIPCQSSRRLNVHRSVRARMGTLYEGESEAGGKRYYPRARFLVEPNWVD